MDKKLRNKTLHGKKLQNENLQNENIYHENIQNEKFHDKKLRRQKRQKFTRQFYRGNLHRLIPAAIAGALANSVNLVISWLMQRILDVASGASQDSLWNITLWCAACVSGFVLTAEVFRRTRTGFLKHAMTNYKELIFSELTKKSIGSFLTENTGSYLSALTNDAASVETNYLRNMFNILNMLITFFGSLALMLWYSPLLTLVSVLLSLLPLAIAALTGGRLATQEQQISSRNESFVSTVKDLLGGFTVIKSFKSEPQVQKLFSEENNKLEETKRRRAMTADGIQNISTTAMVISQLTVFLVAAYLAVNGRVTAGVVIVFVQLMGLILMPISSLPQLLANRRAAFALIDKLAAALEKNVADTDEKLSIPATLESGIRLEGLSFSYEEGKPTLRDINMDFKAGKSYAVVGGSGSGKSTLLNLLIGSCGKYEGNIYYDGNELRTVSPDSLYGLLTIVQQNVFVFNDTVRSNVTMFRNFAEEKIEEALQKSGLSAFIAEKGGDYVCGENGNALSGGEKQRISIARALLGGSPVLLMDEATAALDAATAVSVTNAILDIEGLTRIVVTHRMEEALLSRYDEILVLHGGRIQERGSFADLMKRRGLFYSLYTVAQ